MWSSCFGASGIQSGAEPPELPKDVKIFKKKVTLNIANCGVKEDFQVGNWPSMEMLLHDVVAYHGSVTKLRAEFVGMTVASLRKMCSDLGLAPKGKNKDGLILALVHDNLPPKPKPLTIPLPTSATPADLVAPDGDDITGEFLKRSEDMVEREERKVKDSKLSTNVKFWISGAVVEEVGYRSGESGVLLGVPHCFRKDEMKMWVNAVFFGDLADRRDLDELLGLQNGRCVVGRVRHAANGGPDVVPVDQQMQHTQQTETPDAISLIVRGQDDLFCWRLVMASSGSSGGPDVEEVKVVCVHMICASALGPRNLESIQTLCDLLQTHANIDMH